MALETPGITKSVAPDLVFDADNSRYVTSLDIMAQEGLFCARVYYITKTGYAGYSEPILFEVSDLTRHANTGLQSANVGFEQKIAKIEGDLANKASQQQLDDLSTKVDGLSTTVSVLKTELASVLTEVNLVSASLTQTKTQLVDVSTNLGVIRTHLNELSTTLHPKFVDLNSDLTNLYLYLTSISQTLNDVTRGLVGIGSAVNAISQTLNHPNAGLQVIETRVGTISSTLSLQIADLKTRKAKLDRILQKSHHASTELEALKSTSSALTPEEFSQQIFAIVEGYFNEINKKPIVQP